MEGVTFGIVGINGKFGSFLKRQFTSKGLKVTGCDLDTETTLRETVENSNVVIFSVPISATINVINEAMQYSHPNQLFMDVTSIKTEPVRAMLRSEASVVGTHPMFGPFVGSFRNQVVVLTPARDDELGSNLAFAKNLFSELGARIEITTAEEHDKIMGLVQQLTHFLFFTFGLTIKNSGADLHESLKYVSPVYRIVLSFLGRILNQNPELYYDIQRYNPNTLGNIEHFKQSADQLKALISSENKSEFTDILSQLKQYVGEEEIQFSATLSDRITGFNADLFNSNSITLKANHDRVGLLADITALLRIFEINLVSFHSYKKAGELFFIMSFKKDASDPDLVSAVQIICEKLDLSAC
jgi:prephenate dehydrogenase